jgi:hypothetical protein
VGPKRKTSCWGLTPFYMSQPAAGKQVLKSGPWAHIKEKLILRGGNATFDGKPLVTAAGAVTANGDMPDGAAIS